MWYVHILISVSVRWRSAKNKKKKDKKSEEHFPAENSLFSCLQHIDGGDFKYQVLNLSDVPNIRVCTQTISLNSLPVTRSYCTNTLCVKLPYTLHFLSVFALLSVFQFYRLCAVSLAMRASIRAWIALRCSSTTSALDAAADMAAADLWWSVAPPLPPRSVVPVYVVLLYA